MKNYQIKIVILKTWKKSGRVAILIQRLKTVISACIHFNIKNNAQNDLKNKTTIKVNAHSRLANANHTVMSHTLNVTDFLSEIRESILFLSYYTRVVRKLRSKSS